MRKRILSIIFIFCFIVPCVFILSACGNNPQIGDGTSNTTNMESASGAGDSTEALSQAKSTTKEDVVSYAMTNKTGLDISYQNEIDELVDITKLLIDSKTSESEIDKEKTKCFYKIDLIVLEDNHTKNIANIHSEYDVKINECEELVTEYAKEDMYEGNESDYNNDLASYNSRLQQASIQYDLDLKNAKTQYGGSAPESARIQIQNKYNNTRNKINAEKNETNRLWTNKVNYDTAVQNKNNWKDLKDSKIISENNSYNAKKLEIQAKINAL